MSERNAPFTHPAPAPSLAEVGGARGAANTSAAVPAPTPAEDVTPIPPTGPRPANPRRHRAGDDVDTAPATARHHAGASAHATPGSASGVSAPASLCGSQSLTPAIPATRATPASARAGLALEDTPVFSPAEEASPSPTSRDEGDEGDDDKDEAIDDSRGEDALVQTAPQTARAAMSSSDTLSPSSSDAARKNPLTAEGHVEEADHGVTDARGVNSTDATAGGAGAGGLPSSGGASGAAVHPSTAGGGEGMGMVGVRKTNHGTVLCHGISAVIQNLPNPKTSEEFFQFSDDLDRFRCPLGAELSAVAKDIYGPTTPFHRSLPHTRVLGHKHSDAPNCEHKEPLQLVGGPRFFVPLMLFFCLAIYCALCTVAHYRMCHWALLLVMWLLYVITLVYGMLCAFTNPGIVPMRAYTKDIKDRGNIIVVRVPAPNARKVQERQQEVARQEAQEGKAKAASSRSASPATRRRQNTTHSGLDRYFESATGKLHPVAPLFSEEEKQFKFKDQRGNEGSEGGRRQVAVVEFPLSYCWTCGMYKAPRTHHCAKCNACIDDHDHHCPWTGCCIGRGNYRYFFMCLLSLHCMTIYTILMSIGVCFSWMVANSRKDYADLLAMGYYLAPIVYAMVFAFGIFFTPLFIGHCYMSCKGFTTSEMLKGKFSRSNNYFLGVNPWDAGLVRNVVARLLNRYDNWTDTRYYYAVTIAGVLEDKRVDWLVMLPAEEQAKVQATVAKQKAAMEEAWRSYSDS